MVNTTVSFKHEIGFWSTVLGYCNWYLFLKGTIMKLIRKPSTLNPKHETLNPLSLVASTPWKLSSLKRTEPHGHGEGGRPGPY